MLGEVVAGQLHRDVLLVASGRSGRLRLLVQAAAAGRQQKRRAASRLTGSTISAPAAPLHLDGRRSPAFVQSRRAHASVTTVLGPGRTRRPFCTGPADCQPLGVTARSASPKSSSVSTVRCDGLAPVRILGGVAHGEAVEDKASQPAARDPGRQGGRGVQDAEVRTPAMMTGAARAARPGRGWPSRSGPCPWPPRPRRGRSRRCRRRRWSGSGEWRGRPAPRSVARSLRPKNGMDTKMASSPRLGGAAPPMLELLMAMNAPLPVWPSRGRAAAPAPARSAATRRTGSGARRCAG